MAELVGQSVIDISNECPDEAKRDGRFWTQGDGHEDDWPLAKFTERLHDAMDALEMFSARHDLVFHISGHGKTPFTVSFTRKRFHGLIPGKTVGKGTDLELPMAICKAIIQAGAKL